MMKNWLVLLVLMLSLVPLPPLHCAENRIFNVRDCGAVGDGKTLDTKALQAAIDATPNDGLRNTVRVPPGTYLTGTLFLKSHLVLQIEPGATILGTKDLAHYTNRLREEGPVELAAGYRLALFFGKGIEDVEICGGGTINGNTVFNPRGENERRGPQTFFIDRSHKISVRDILIKDASNYAMCLINTNDIYVRNVVIEGGWDGIHMRGNTNVVIRNCEFYTGDDCIAGEHWKDVVISGCILNSQHNGVRVIGPVEQVIISDCLIYGPPKFGIADLSTGYIRQSMLAGICIQPGAWVRGRGKVEDVLLSNLTMRRVGTPFHIIMNSGYHGNNLTIENVSASATHSVAASIETWGDASFDNIRLRNVSMDFIGGYQEDPQSLKVETPPVDIRTLPTWGLYLRDLKNIQIENVRLNVSNADARPAFIAENVNELVTDGFSYPPNDNR